MRDKAFITCALSGSRSRKSCPNVPVTPEEFAVEARRAYDAGAAVVHVHARDPDTGEPSSRTEDFRRIVAAIQSAVPDIHINLTSGGLRLPAEERIAPIRELRPALGAISMGSFNFATAGRIDRSVIFENSFADICHLLGVMSDVDVVPDYECYEIGHISNVRLCADSGYAIPGVYSLILGIDGAIEARTDNLVWLVQQLPRSAHWDAVVPRYPEQWKLLAAALSLGGSIRVGFEDNVYLADGSVASSNGALVDKAAHMIAELGLSIGGSEEFETLLSAPCG